MARIEEIMLNLNIRHIRLEELELKAARRKHRRDREGQFAVRQTNLRYGLAHLITRKQIKSRHK